MIDPKHFYPHHEGVVQAYLAARDDGRDPHRPVFKAQFGELAYNPEGAAYRTVTGWIERFSAIVAAHEERI